MRVVNITNDLWFIDCSCNNRLKLTIIHKVKGLLLTKELDHINPCLSGC